MHGRVYPALEESLLELFGEEALPLHVGLGTHRLLIPRCANNDQVARDSAARQEGLHALSLPKRQRTSTGSDSKASHIARNIEAERRGGIEGGPDPPRRGDPFS